MSDIDLEAIEKRRAAFRSWEAFCAEGYQLLDEDVPALITTVARMELYLTKHEKALGRDLSDVLYSQDWRARAEKAEEKFKLTIDYAGEMTARAYKAEAVVEASKTLIRYLQHAPEAIGVLQSDDTALDRLIEAVEEWEAEQTPPPIRQRGEGIADS